MDLPLRIINHLSRYWDESAGFLCDPETGKQIKNSYGNSFYALCCTRLYLKNKNKVWLKRAEGCINAELNIAKVYYNTEGIYRWEFKNYALLNCYSLAKDIFNPKLKNDLKKYLLGFKNINSFQSNYMMMRSLNYLIRYQIFKKPSDYWRSKVELNLVLSRQDKEGFFYDTPKSKSFQYHAYILALLAQYHEISRCKKVKHLLLRGVKFILPFINPKGDFNYLGRGQKQVFGYASLIFALNYTSKITKNNYYSEIVEKMMSFVEPTLKKFQIVAAPRQDLKNGWYLYNNYSDYLAFSAHYLIKWGDLTPASDKSQIIFDYNKPFNKFYSKLGIFLFRESNFILCLSLSNKHFNQNPIICYSYPPIFPTSGPKSILVKNQDQNSEIYFGITGQKKYNLFSKKNSLYFTSNKDYVKFYFANEVFVSWNNKLHYLSKRTLAGERKSRLLTLDGNYDLFESEPGKLSFGKIKHQKIKHFSRKEGNSGLLAFNLQKILFFSLILCYKLLFDFTDFKQMIKYYKVRQKYY